MWCRTWWSQYRKRAATEANTQSINLECRPALDHLDFTGISSNRDPFTSMTPRCELRREVRHLIKPWKASTDKPPFTAEELVVIALLLSSSSGVNQITVLQVITQNFGYYTKLAIGCTPHAHTKYLGMRHRDTESTTANFQCELDMAYRRYDVPIESVARSGTGGSAARKWKVTSGAARIFLHKRLAPLMNSEEAQKPFPFMRLPAELRNRVYELAFQLPSSGVCVKVKSEKGSKEPQSIPARFSVMRNGDGILSSPYNSSLSPAFQDFASYTRPGQLPSGVMFCPSAATHLALLQVCKQIHQEASPVFYTINNFTFDTVKHLWWFLEATPAARRDHIEHISFYYVEGDEKYAGSVFRLLKDMPHLRELDIAVNEGSWKAMTTGRSSKKYPDVLKIPGVPTLRSIRGLKAVRFHGDCETFKTMIPEMTSAKKPIKVSRKRKAKAGVGDDEAGEDPEGEAGQTKKKAKKSTNAAADATKTKTMGGKTPSLKRTRAKKKIYYHGDSDDDDW